MYPEGKNKEWSSDSHESEDSSESDEFISYNRDIYGIMRAIAASEKDSFKKKTYNHAAETLFHPLIVLKILMSLPRYSHHMQGSCYYYYLRRRSYVRTKVRMKVPS